MTQDRKQFKRKQVAQAGGYRPKHRSSKAKDVVLNTNGGSVGTTISQRMISGAGGIPVSKNVVLRYAETFTLSTGTAGVVGTVQDMILNSLYDPNLTGTGHQPYLYDTYQAQYASYRVNTCKVELLWGNIGGSNEIMLASQVSAPYTYLSMAGQTTDRITEMNNICTAMLSPYGKDRVVKQTFVFPIHKIFGISKAKYNDDDKYSALVSASPAEAITLSLGVGSYTATAGEACTCQVVMTFYASLWDRKFQAQS